MKTKFTLLILLLASFGSLHAQTKLKNPEPFGKKVFRALQKGKSLDKYRLLEKDKPWILEVFQSSTQLGLNGSTPQEIEKQVDRKFRTYQRNYEEECESLFEIDWARAKLGEITYELERHDLRVFEAELDIDFTLDGEKYVLHLEDCVLTPRGWRLGDGPRVRESHNPYDWKEGSSETTEERVDPAEQFRDMSPEEFRQMMEELEMYEEGTEFYEETSPEVSEQMLRDGEMEWEEAEEAEEMTPEQIRQWTEDMERQSREAEEGQ